MQRAYYKVCILFLLTVILVLLSSEKTFSQWTKVTDYNVGATGKMAIHDSTVFLYGYNGGAFVYRSTNNGTNWTNVADQFPQSDQILFIYSMGSEVFAAVGSNDIYSSTNDGINWNKKSTVPQATGPTASGLVNLTSDGTSLFAVTNRASVFKSTDNGSTWNEIHIDYSPAQLYGFDFAIIGSKMVFSAANLGTFYTTDGGTNWSLKNSPIVGSVHPFKNEFYGSSNGLYKFVADTGWAPYNSGLPVSAFASTKCEISNSQNIFTYYTDLLAGSKIFVSSDNGNNWNEAGTDLPTSTTSALNDFMTVTDNYLYCYIYSLFPSSATGVYKLPLQSATGIEKANSGIPANFVLSQNYPNPFNPSTNIKFQISKSSFVSLKIYDVLGKEVANLVSENLNAGSYTYNFDASGLTSGIYFYTLKTNNFIETKKMILIK